MYKKEAFARLFSIFSCQHIKDPDLYTTVHPLHLGAKPLLAEVRAKHRAVCQKPSTTNNKYLAISRRMIFQIQGRFSTA